MSEKKEPLKLIQGEKEHISDEDFQVFLDALFGPYKGGGYLPE